MKERLHLTTNRTNTPPYEPEAERSVLGMMLYGEPDIMAYGLENLDEGLFYQPKHQLIFRAIKTCAAGGELVDLLLVTAELRERGRLDDAGGQGYVSTIAANQVIIIERMREHVEKLKEYAARRSLLNIAHKIYDSVALGDPADLLESVTRDLKRTEDIQGNGVIDTDKIMPALMSRWELIRKGRPPYIQSGFHDIDSILGDGAAKIEGGFTRGEMVHIKGERKKGKSALLLQTLDQMVNQGHRVLLISLEMRRDKIWARVTASRLYRMRLVEENFSYKQIWNSDQWRTDRPDWRAAVDYTEGWFIDDREMMSPGEVISVAGKHIRKYGVDVVALDHANLVSFYEGHSQQDKEIFIERLRAFTKVKDIVFFVLTQIQPKDDWAYYFKTLEHSAGSIVHVEIGKEGREAAVEILSRDGAWGKKTFKFLGNVQTFKSVDGGGGFHVPNKEFRERCTAAATESDTLPRTMGGSRDESKGVGRDSSAATVDDRGFGTEIEGSGNTGPRLDDPLEGLYDEEDEIG